MNRRTVLLSIALLLPWTGCTAIATDRVDPVNEAGGVGIGGYDPVAYFTEGRPVAGSAAHQREWDDVTYRFSSDQNATRFEEAPEDFLPAYGGYCAYAMSLNRIAEVDPERWDVRDGRLFLNANRVASLLWRIGESENIEAADRHWATYPRTD